MMREKTRIPSLRRWALLLSLAVLLPIGVTALTAGIGQASAPAAGRIAHVTIQAFKFSPATLKIKAGTTVIWTNKDSVAHTVTATSGGHFNSGRRERNQTYSFTFSKPGTYKYVCTIHPFMKGTVSVTK
jgi:amicyanin